MRDDIRVKMVMAAILFLGLSAPAWGWEPSKFDSGNKGTSALGQLEDLAGQKVDRSPGVSTIDTYKKKIILPQKPVAKPKVNPSASMEAMVTGMVVGSLLQAALSDNSQDEAAARAMAEAEQKRLAEEQRQQRLISASNLRNFWDGNDQAMSESLDDVFSVPGQKQGTAFFGIQHNPPGTGQEVPSKGQDAGPVEITGTTPSILGSGAPDVLGVTLAPSETLTTETSSLQDGILKSGVEFAKDTAKDIVKDLVKNALPTSARNAELMVEHVDKMKEFTDSLFQAIEPQRLVGTLAGGGPGDYQAIMDDLDSATRKGAALGFGETPFSDEEIQTGFKLINGERITSTEAKGLMADRLKGYLSGKLKDSLTEGWM